MCVLIGVNQLGFGSIVPTISLYAKSFGVSATAIGMAVAIYGLGRMFAAPPAGNLSDRFGRRHTLALGGVVTALGNLICALATVSQRVLPSPTVSWALHHWRCRTSLYRWCRDRCACPGTRR